tara:strand:- start:213 stop:494 length:282 start_codon:yes stop_codon:yes gene_type:complete
MKFNKEQLKQVIREELDTQAAEPKLTTRQKKVATATTSGALMPAEEYVAMLKQVLLTPKVTAQIRKAALESIFGNKGTAINALVLQMLKGAQE